MVELYISKRHYFLYYIQQMAVYSPVTAFLLLISSALVLEAAIYYRRHEKVFHGQFEQICDIEPCGNVEAAGVRVIIQD